MQRRRVQVARGAMPFALQIATVQDDDHAAAARLRAIMAEQLVVKGWRHEAFEALVRESRDRARCAVELVRPERPGRGPPHASNHTRRMLLAALDDETILTRVAGPRLEKLVKAAQRDDHGRPAAGPAGRRQPAPRSRAAVGPLAPADDVPWDEFLLGSLARATRPDHAAERDGPAPKSNSASGTTSASRATSSCRSDSRRH